MICHNDPHNGNIMISNDVYNGTVFNETSFDDSANFFDFCDKIDSNLKSTYKNYERRDIGRF